MKSRIPSAVVVVGPDKLGIASCIRDRGMTVLHLNSWDSGDLNLQGIEASAVVLDGALAGAIQVVEKIKSDFVMSTVPLVVIGGNSTNVLNNRVARQFGIDRFVDEELGADEIASYVIKVASAEPAFGVSEKSDEVERALQVASGIGGAVDEDRNSDQESESFSINDAISQVERRLKDAVEFGKRPGENVENEHDEMEIESYFGRPDEQESTLEDDRKKRSGSVVAGGNAKGLVQGNDPKKSWQAVATRLWKFSHLMLELTEDNAREEKKDALNGLLAQIDRRLWGGGLEETEILCLKRARDLLESLGQMVLEPELKDLFRKMDNSR